MKVLEERKARSTGTTVRLIDNRDKGYKEEGEKWYIECATHGYSDAHTGRMIAEEHLAHPENWCDVCKGDVEEVAAPPLFSKH